MSTFELQVVYFVNSGSEANELAMLMARLYTGNLGMISLRNAYHGGSSSTMGLTALNTWKYPLPEVCFFMLHQNISIHPAYGPFESNRHYKLKYTVHMDSGNYVIFPKCGV